jgi:hypothetical protein
MLIVRSDGPVADPGWVVEAISLEDLVLAYMGQGRRSERGMSGESRES